MLASTRNVITKKFGKLHLRTLFAEDPQRGERMAVEAVGIYFDYSKHRITDETVKLLLQLAEDAQLHVSVSKRCLKVRKLM